jgi:serine/threonine protein phosphatase 1
MKNTYFVFSDVHGEYDDLVAALNEAGYDINNPRHILASCGDNFDRGPDSMQVLRLLRRRKDNIWVRGNHEEMLLEAVEKGVDGEFVLFNLLHNGLDATIQSLSGVAMPPTLSAQEINQHIDIARDTARSVTGNSLGLILKQLPYYYETKNYIFVHAGFEPNIDWNASSKDVMLWDIEYSHLPIRTTNKTVIIGHHHAARVRKNAADHGYAEQAIGVPWYGNHDENRPVRIGNKIAIDPCSNLTKKVNVLVIEDEPLDATPEKEKPTEEVKIKVSGDLRGYTYNANVWDTNVWHDTTTTIRYR